MWHFSFGIKVKKNKKKNNKTIKDHKWKTQTFRLYRFGETGTRKIIFLFICLSLRAISSCKSTNKVLLSPVLVMTAVRLTCRLRRCTWAACPRWTSSTWGSLAAGRDSYRWTRWCRLSCRPAWRCSGRRNTPPACRWRSARACTPGFSCAPARPVCAGLYKNNAVWVFSILAPIQ